MLALLGLMVVIVGWLLPAREVRINAAHNRLDEFIPVYQFHEFHTIEVAASRQQVAQAIKAVTADEISLFRTLIWIRRFGRKGPEDILNPPRNTPILDVATRTTFILLAEEPEREMVFGTLIGAPQGWHPQGHATPEGFKKLHDPGFALAAMNFAIEETRPGLCTVTTETRVYGPPISGEAPARRTVGSIHTGFGGGGAEPRPGCLNRKVHGCEREAWVVQFFKSFRCGVALRTPPLWSANQRSKHHFTFWLFGQQDKRGSRGYVKDRYVSGWIEDVFRSFPAKTADPYQCA